MNSPEPDPDNPDPDNPDPDSPDPDNPDPDPDEPDPDNPDPDSLDSENSDPDIPSSLRFQLLARPPSDKSQLLRSRSALLHFWYQYLPSPRSYLRLPPNSSTPTSLPTPFHNILSSCSLWYHQLCLPWIHSVYIYNSHTQEFTLPYNQHVTMLNIPPFHTIGTHTHPNPTVLLHPPTYHLPSVCLLSPKSVYTWCLEALHTPPALH